MVVWLWVGGAAIPVRGASSAALRIGGVLGIFTAVRCTVERELDMPISAPFIAGAVAVAIPTAVDTNRQRFLTAYVPPIAPARTDTIV